MARATLIHICTIVILVLGAVGCARAEGASTPAWTGRIDLSSILQGELRWMEYSDSTSNKLKSRSDIYIRSFELDVESAMFEGATVSAVLLGEYIGDELHMGDGTVAIDEASMDLQSPRCPLSGSLGFKTQAFGIFQNMLISDPLTDDAYETKTTGIEIGYDAIISPVVSVYKGDVLMGQLLDSGLFDGESLSRKPGELRGIESFIVSFSTGRLLQSSVILFGGYSSEPGRGERNTTLDAGLNLVVPSIQQLMIDIEYGKAIDREIYEGLNREYKESVLSVTGSFHHTFIERERLGSRTFAERKSNVEKHAVFLALRYEYFGDDNLTKEVGIWSVEDRIGMGGRIRLAESPNLKVFINAEYSRTSYRLTEDLKKTMVDESDGLLIALGALF
jgi:hypothetical protein